MTLLDEKLAKEDEIKAVNDEQLHVIAKRAGELMALFPEKAHLFDDYVKSSKRNAISLKMRSSVLQCS